MNKVLIVYPYSNLSTNPTMGLLIEALNAAGYQVDLITDTAHVHEFPESGSLGGRGRQLDVDQRVWWQPRPPGLAKRLWQIWQQPAAIDPVWFRTFAARKYFCVLGVDPLGIATASRLIRGISLPLIYVSFEILLSDEANGEDEQLLKAAERDAVQNCSLILIQDPERGHLFAQDLGIDEGRLCYVPVAPVGALPEKTNYLRRRLGIAAQQRLVLFQGTLGAWSGRDEWQSLLSCWPEQIALVIHSRRKLAARDRKFLASLASRYPVYISDEPVSQQELFVLTASADVGLVSYFPNPDHWHTYGNLKTIGLASGKLATCLLCGVPVLANRQTALGQWVEDHHLGAAYDSPQSSAPALERILANHELLSATTRRVYEQQLDPTRPLAEFVSRLSGL